MKRRCYFVSGLVILLASAPLQAANVFKGKEVYTRHCMGCHGPSGEGMMPGLPNFSRGEQLFKSDRELIDAIRDGSGVMPSFNGLLEDEQMEDVVAYLRTFL